MVVTSSQPLQIGSWKAYDFALIGTDDAIHTLLEFQRGKGTVIFFTCNHCPYAKASWPVMIELANTYMNREISFIAINPNALSHPDDSFEKMKEEVIARSIPFPYLLDDTQETAQNYHAQCTPDIYLFDSYMMLYYHGRINDNWQEQGEVTQHNLRDAIDQLLQGDSAPALQPPSMGCSIKWQ